MSFEVTDLPENEREGKSVSVLDANIKKDLIKSNKEFENRPWFKVITNYKLKFTEDKWILLILLFIIYN